MTPRQFDVCGPLPTGVTVLEASAGTGKTFTIAALAVRFVAEAGVPLDELLLITFTRAATSELRERVRKAFIDAEAYLARAAAGEPVDEADRLHAHLASSPDVAVRHGRIAKAIAHFDAVTIATTHGFCQHVLGGLGVAGDVDRDAAFVEDPRALVDEVVDDLYVRKFWPQGAADPPFAVSEARTLALAAVANSDATLEPAGARRDSPDNLRYRIVDAARREVDRRRRAASVLTFDDLLTRLKATLADPERGAAACQRLRDRYRVVLVDEFQDTDPIQWDILRRAFTTAPSTLVLIGDPKQAIYAFRGADVHAYLAAASEAEDVATLATNWRSDQAVLDALDALFGRTRLGHDHIEYRRVAACDEHVPRRLAGAPDDAALRVRIMPRTPGKSYVAVGRARTEIAADLAADVVSLLASGATFAGHDVVAGDVAVLVHRNADARIVQKALVEAGVPAVINGAGSVFATEAALQWRALLEALERPSARTPAVAVGLSPFVGWSPSRVAGATEDDWEELHSLLHRWSAVLRRRGVASLLETVSVQRGMPGRVLAQEGGERRLTDLRHVGQLLHTVATKEQLGTTALVNWLRLRIEDADEEKAEAEDRTRRLESDAEAVQVLTVYRAKGLEYLFVYAPYLWDPGYIHPDAPPVYHEPDHGRVLDVGSDPENLASTRALVERRGEELRLLYVALTRAMVQAVVWWAPSRDCTRGPLSRVVFSRRPDGSVPANVPDSRRPSDATAVERFEEIAAAAPEGCVSVSVMGDGTPVPPAAGSAVRGDVAVEDLAHAVFDRDLDPRWRRTSYTGITAGAHEARVASEAEEPVVSDESVVVAAGTADGGGAPSLLATMRSGAEVGTFVHGVLEATDFTAPDLAAAVSEAFDGAAGRSIVDVDVGDRDEVVRGLAAVIETPLGPVLDGLRLRDVGRRDRVDELWFELPLVGGDAPTGALTTDAIGDVLRAYCGADDVLRGYADHLDDPSLRSELRGYLAGSLDVVLRTPDGRYAVADYKSNWLGVDGQELSTWHYRPGALVDAMYRAHYPLQALLYTVALHRYLRWRVAGYAPESHLAGVLYLFVRGMVGAPTPVVDGQPCGVFGWRPPAGVVSALSDLFDRGTSA